MKRLIPYIFLQISLASLMGCAAMHPAGSHESRSAYRVTLIVPAPYAEEMNPVLASLPGAAISGAIPVNVTNQTMPPYQRYEFRLPDQGALQAFRSALQNTGLPLSGLQIQEVTL